MINKNVVAIIDGEAGSCGKAKVIGEIATDQSLNIGAAITNCMPNAGHTFVSETGKKYIFRNIPVSTVNPACELFIGPGSSIDMNTFIEEYESIKHLLKDRLIYVHEMVPLIEEKHKNYEREHVKSGSTFKGCGAVSKDKIMREPQLKFFSGYKNAIRVSNDEWIARLYEHLDSEEELVILEGAQGCDLSINFSGNYPFVTSRNVSTAQLLADSGIPASRLLETIMVIRPFPIRISNVTTTGEYIYTGAYGTGSQLTWLHINLSSKFNCYPTATDFELHDNYVTEELKEKLIKESLGISLMQIFGTEDMNIDLSKVTLIDCLEMERLINKNKGINKYISQVIDLSSTEDESITDLSEMTTVTKMERRVFDLDITKLKTNCLINEPYGIYLNFFEHLSQNIHHEIGEFNQFYFNRYLRNYFNYLEETLETDILALGTGMKNNERILKKKLIKKR